MLYIIALFILGIRKEKLMLHDDKWVSGKSTVQEDNIIIIRHFQILLFLKLSLFLSYHSFFLSRSNTQLRL
jgi:hypothetical protein